MKKVYYKEPEMPENLKKLLGLDIEDSVEDYERERSRSRVKKKKPNRPTHRQGEVKARKSNQRQVNSKKRPVNRSDREPLEKDKSINARRKPQRPVKSSERALKEDLYDNRKSSLDKKANKPKSKSMLGKKQTVKSSKKDYENSVKKSNIGQNRDDISKARREPLNKPKSKRAEIEALEKRKQAKKSKNPKVKKRTRSKAVKPKKGFFKKILFYIVAIINFVVYGSDNSVKLTKEKKTVLDNRFMKIVTVGFFGVLLIFTLMFLTSPKEKTSVAENRDLNVKPKFTLGTYIDGKYSSKYSGYLSDHFPHRSGLIKLKAKFDLAMGKKEINGVYVGKDGYLMEGFKKEDNETLQNKIDAINNFAKDNSKLNIAVMLVPNKVEIYKNLMPKNSPVDSQEKYIENIYSLLNKNIKKVNSLPELKRNKNGQELYFKTDHHWTTDGAYEGYLAYCKAVRIQPTNVQTFTRSLATDKFKGSLYYKNGAQIGDPEEMYLYIQQGNFPVITRYFDAKKKVPSLYDVDKLDGRDPYEVFTGGNHGKIKIRTNVESDKRLLVIKDSYANSMLPFLVNNYSEIIVLDLRYFSDSVKEEIATNDITDVLILNNVNTFSTDSSILNIND